MIILPVTSDPAQTFVAQLEEIRLIFDIQWNDRSQLFSLTLSNDITEQVYFKGVPLLLGTDFLEPYNYNIGSLMMYDSQGQGVEANLDNIGVTVNLVWLSEEDKSAALATI